MTNESNMVGEREIITIVVSAVITFLLTILPPKHPVNKRISDTLKVKESYVLAAELFGPTLVVLIWGLLRKI